MDDPITINVVENAMIPNQFSFDYIKNLIMENKTYLLIGIVILAALGYYIYITYFIKNNNNKIKEKLYDAILSDNSDEEVVIKKPKSKIVKPVKKERKVIIQESSDSEPNHLANLDLTQSELNNINNSLEK